MYIVQELVQQCIYCITKRKMTTKKTLKPPQCLFCCPHEKIVLDSVSGVAHWGRVEAAADGTSAHPLGFWLKICPTSLTQVTAQSTESVEDGRHFEFTFRKWQKQVFNTWKSSTPAAENTNVVCSVRTDCVPAQLGIQRWRPCGSLTVTCCGLHVLYSFVRPSAGDPLNCSELRRHTVVFSLDSVLWVDSSFMWWVTQPNTAADPLKII